VEDKGSSDMHALDKYPLETSMTLKGGRMIYYGL